MIRFVLVAIGFYVAQLVFWPACATALMWGTVKGVECLVRGLLWCRRQFFPVVAHHGRKPEVFSAPQRAQRHRVEVAGYR